jgi:hypothetical protein
LASASKSLICAHTLSAGASMVIFSITFCRVGPWASAVPASVEATGQGQRREGEPP